MLHGTTKGEAPSYEIKIIVTLPNGLLQLHGLFMYFRGREAEEGIRMKQYAMKSEGREDEIN